MRELAHSGSVPDAEIAAEATRDLAILAWELAAGNLDLLRRLTA